MRHLLWFCLLPALAGCATAVAAPDPADRFFASLRAACGRAFEGRVTTTDEADRVFSASRLVIHVRSCSAREIRIPFQVGNNRSRTWVISRTPSGLRLKHVHRHEDGSLDPLTDYGGDTVAAGTATRQEFPADAFSRDLFVARNLPQSLPNVWAVEVERGRLFAYELRRPGRHFRVEFDLTRPVPAPPANWGE